MSYWVIMNLMKNMRKEKMMNLKINKMLVPKNKHSIKCPFSMTPKWVVVHNTWNTAPARSEALYMLGNNNNTSFHYVVDEKEAYQLIEETRNAWHAG